MSVVLDPKEWEPITSSKIEIKHSKNVVLTNEIVKHVFANLGISEERRGSVIHDVFRSNKTLSFTDDNGKQTVSVFGCKVNVEGKRFQIVAVKLSETESAFVSRLEGCPVYGCYFGDECLVGVLAKDRWIEGSMFIQASFLAGMEQLREVGTIFTRMNDVSEMFEMLKTFLVFEGDNE
jgi:hypothetical protein